MGQHTHKVHKFSSIMTVTDISFSGIRFSSKLLQGPCHLQHKATLLPLHRPVNHHRRSITLPPHRNSLNPRHRLLHPLLAGQQLQHQHLACLGRCRLSPQIHLLSLLGHLQRRQNNEIQITTASPARTRRHRHPSKRFPLRLTNLYIKQMESRNRGV